ncbi:MAG: response regulator [Cyanosarcina radialis HA8281-LM2]|jgi:CheY-like chemotaxis protein|nr:response regulator [Cyanosarcina radialis HA8281-LM2]
MNLPIKKRILCVDDSPDNAQLLSFILDEAKYQIQTAQSVQEAWKLSQTDEFDLYVVDLRFSNGSHGFDLIEQIRAIDRVTPIVVCSGDVRESVEEEAMQIGVQAFLRKPIDIDLCVITIIELLKEDL